MKNKIQPAVYLSLLYLAFVLPAHAQGTMFTYQGRMTAGGTAFTGSGQFKFALVTSTNVNHTAAATANINSGFITSYNVTFGGNGYTSAPAVTVSGGGGAGALATASVSGGAVTSLTANNPGAGYSGVPTVLIAPPPANFSYTTYWSNDGTSVNGSEPTATVSVPVSNGLFTVVLGDPTQPNMTAISAALFNRPNLQLRIWFNDGAHGWAALDPAQSLTPTPYAVFANTASNLVNGLSIQQNTNGAPNVIGGASVNYVSNGVVGATIAGGGAIKYNGVSFTNSVTGNFGTVSGGAVNIVSAFAATVSGGYNNTASGIDATVSGGDENTASGIDATVGGGLVNIASANSATVGGGQGNTASANSATVSGGLGNSASNAGATVGGGEGNSAGGIDATVAGGFGNSAWGHSATVSGGSLNNASGDYSFAAGLYAQALHQGSFVWADSLSTPFASTANNQFSVRASGGVRLIGNVQIGDGGGDYKRLQMGGGNSSGFLYGSYPKFGDGLHLGYNYYADASGGNHALNADGATSRITVGYGSIGLYVGEANAAPMTQRLLADTKHIEVNGTFNNNSDRNTKQDFAPVSASQILEQVLRLPVSEWSYRDDSKTRHVGPMAQDFHAAFQIGTDDKHIAPIDEGGVAFAAIQGLNAKVESRSQKLEVRNDKSEQKIQQLEAENARLRGDLDELKSIVKSLNDKQNGIVK